MVVSRRLALLSLGVCLIWIAGCGGASGPKLPEGPRGSATAKVTYDGKFITVGTLVLDSGQGFIASGTPNAEGVFTLKGPKGEEIPAGTYTVGISPPPAPEPAAGQMPEPPKIDGVPAKFYVPSTSKVTVEVKAGKQQLDIMLR